MRTYFVYILSNKRRTVLYIGVTNDLERRVYEHRSKIVEGFTKQYNCDELLYFEETNSIEDAIAREKQLKKWSRAKKLSLIQRQNHNLRDLSTEFILSRAEGLEMTG